jgi:hypothetical protein
LALYKSNDIIITFTEKRLLNAASTPAKKIPDFLTIKKEKRESITNSKVEQYYIELTDNLASAVGLPQK